MVELLLKDLTHLGLITAFALIALVCGCRPNSLNI